MSGYDDYETHVAESLAEWEDQEAADALEAEWAMLADLRVWEAEQMAMPALDWSGRTLDSPPF